MSSTLILHLVQTLDITDRRDVGLRVETSLYLVFVFSAALFAIKWEPHWVAIQRVAARIITIHVPLDRVSTVCFSLKIYVENFFSAVMLFCLTALH